MECLATAEFSIVFTFFTFALTAKAKQDISEKFVSYDWIRENLISIHLDWACFVQLHPCLCINGSWWKQWPIGTCRPGHTRALPGLFQIMPTHITRTGCEDTWSTGEACPQTPYIAYACIWMQRCTYSVQCSDKIHFPQVHAHQMQRSQVLPGYAHSSAGTYARAPQGMKLKFLYIPL